MTAPADPGVAAPPARRLSQSEFIALVATLFATIAFSIDAMLPAMPDLAAALSPAEPNRAQLIVTSFVLGMGIGTLFTGPLSDSLGRRPVVIAGAAIYVVAAAVAATAQSLEWMLAARVLQGLGAAGPRVAAMAMVRDLYAGREMARIMSFVLLIFTLIPAFAPTLGAGIIWLAGWQGIFAAFVVFALIGATWLALRQPETLPPEKRRPFSARALAAGVREILSHPVAAAAIVVQSFAFGCLFLTLSTTQQVFDQTFGQGAHFHLWFGAIAICAGSASLLNAAIVQRLGMRLIVRITFQVQLVLTAAYCLTLYVPGMPPGLSFWLYMVWTTAMFFQAGMTIGNLNALAMEPMGHLAGLAASVTGSVATLAALVFAVPIGLLFDGTPRPIALGTLALILAAVLGMRRL